LSSRFGFRGDCSLYLQWFVSGNSYIAIRAQSLADGIRLVYNFAEIYVTM